MTATREYFRLSPKSGEGEKNFHKGISSRGGKENIKEANDVTATT